MTELFMFGAAMILATIIFLVLYINERNQQKIEEYEMKIEELESVNTSLEEANHKLAEKIEDSINEKNKINTGNDTDDFDNSIDFLHKFAHRGDKDDSSTNKNISS